MSTNRTPAQIETEALEALRLHNLGLTEREIAERMSAEGRTISQPTVHRRIEYALERYVLPELDEARKAALARLDALYEALAPQLAAGNAKAVDTALKLEAQRARILGLEKAPEPTKPEAAPTPAIFKLFEDVEKHANGKA